MNVAREQRKARGGFAWKVPRSAASERDVANGMGGYFTSDRAAKYGWGVPRLALVTLFAFEIVPRAFLAGSRAPVDALVSTPLPFTARAAAAPFAPLTLVPYLHSLRWIAHAYTGSIGAGVNVQVLGLLGNLAIMAVAGGLCLWDLTKDISLVVYFLKTFCGCLLYTSPSPRDATLSRMPSSA